MTSAVQSVGFTISVALIDGLMLQPPLGRFTGILSLKVSCWVANWADNGWKQPRNRNSQNFSYGRGVNEHLLYNLAAFVICGLHPQKPLFASGHK